MRVLWLTAAAIAVAIPAYADPLTYAGAIALAEDTAPSLQGSALQVEAARASRRAAGRLPDPKLQLGIEGFPVSGPNAGRPGNEDFTAARVGLSQDLPNGARRSAAVAGAVADIGVAEAEAGVERRKVRVATALAWIDLAYAERQLAALDELVSGLKGLWVAQPSSIVSGAARPAAGLEPKRLQAVFADQRSELVGAMIRARAELTRWTGDPAPSTSGEAPHYDIDPATLRSDLERHPSLLQMQAVSQRAEAEVAAARAGLRPDWGVEASYARRDPRFGDLLSAGVTVSLPLFKATRQEPVVAARLADRNRIRVGIEDARRSLRAGLDSDLADHAMHHEQWRRGVDVLVPTAEQRSHLELSSYAAGRADFDDVRQALTDLANAKLTALERGASVARDGARIILTYGSDQ